MIIVDTGPLVAAADADDHDHARCVAMFQAARRPWLVPQPVIAEICHLLERERGSQAEAAFLRSFGRREMTLAPLTIAVTDRMTELVETYASLSLRGVDAAVIAIAERLNVATVATLNRRDFAVVRPRHVNARVLPLHRASNGHGGHRPDCRHGATHNRGGVDDTAAVYHRRHRMGV